MQFSTAEKALYLKIVYYGPGLSGKTTNLESIHRITDPDGRNNMISLRTQEDRTLFFDLLPFNLGRLYGLDVRLKLYTVPGQIQYDTTRRQVLAGADGVVFVADSQRKQLDENARMIRYLVNNLTDNGLDPRTIPIVFQWNKQDLPDLTPPDQLEAKLNYRHAPAIPAVATIGTGVIETFCEIAIHTMESLATRAPNLADKLRAMKVRQDVERIFQPFVGDKPLRVTGPVATSITRSRERSVESGSDRPILGLDDLLSEAVSANIALSEQLLTASVPDATAARRERAAITKLANLGLAATNLELVLKTALASALSALDLEVGSILLKRQPGAPLQPVAIEGCAMDPLNAIVTPGLGSVAAGLLDRQKPVLVQDIAAELLFGQAAPSVAGLRGAAAVPLGAARPAAALLVVYTKARGRDLGAEDLEVLELIASVAALALRAATLETQRATARATR